MIGNKRNFSLSLWDHEDNFLCNLKSANLDFKGQSFNENFIENINGEKSLTFSIPMYIFDIENSETGTKTTDKKYFKQNEIWNYIYNEQKIRYIEYNDETNEQERIEEFVLKTYVESRNGEEKIAECTCETLAVYELSKVGWNINFNTDYVTSYELSIDEEGKPLDTNYCPDVLTLDYWLKKIFYKETNLGRVSTTTECTYLLQGKQLRNEKGFPIDSVYGINKDGDVEYVIINEPICTSTQSELEQSKYYNPTGWTWNVQAKDERNPANEELTNILYETPVINKYIEFSDQYKPFSYQKGINELDEQKILLPHPIEEMDYGKLVYVTDVKKRLFSIERSNVYNIIQELCNVFQIFAYFQYHYNDSGVIDKREILFKTEAINDDIEFDFSYGKNLLSCQRSTDTNELVTKLIVPDTESTLNEGSILSIKEATGNPTGEGYLYNFKYFYDCGMLTTMEQMEKEERSLLESDEYKINLHNSKLKDYNTSIVKLQKFLTPLYDRQDKLNSDLLVQRSSRTAIMDNMRSIQDKIDAIPVEQQIIKSWSQFSTQYNHIGEIKTVATTTEEDGNEVLYINFGREDIVFDEVNVISYTIDANNNIVEGTTTSISSFIPRCFNKSTWVPSSSTETGKIPDNNTSNFILFSTTTTIEGHSGPLVKEIVYSSIRDKQTGFISGIKFNYLPLNNQSFIRIRYQYAPLVWYYLLIKDYWEQLLEVENRIDEIESQLQEITNKILINELSLNNLLQEKNEEILQFEKKYKPYIREGYWEANDYQSQISFKVLDTRNPVTPFEKLDIKEYLLKDLNLNESLSNYSYYVDLDILATSIDIDSIDIKTKNPAYSAGGNTILPRYRGNDYEVYIDTRNKVIIAISPTLIDTYNKYHYDKDKYYACDISYNLINGEKQSFSDVHWKSIELYGSPEVIEKIIYITNDNILTDSIEVYGGSTTTNPLELYTDYTYIFDYIGYNEGGEVIDLDDQSSYSTDIYYDYITKITLKNTNEVNKYNNFYVTYKEETTLQYLYQDAVFTSRKYAEPKITYSINVVDISSLQGFENYKPKIGQKVPIYDNEMKLNGFEGFITSVSKQLESKQNTQITIATYSSKFEDVFQKLTATMTDVKYNENAIYNAANAITDTGTINSDVFQKSLIDNSYQISLGVNNEITIDKSSGVTLVDLDNNTAVKLIGRGVFLTKEYKGDKESLWRTGITGEGINANALITGNIDTKNINIWNATEGQIRFMWNEQGLTAYGATGVTGSSTSSPQDFVDYNKYVRYNYEGLEFTDKSGDIVRSALKLGWDGLQIRAQEEALNLDASSGLTLKKNNKNRLELGKFNESLYGLKLRDDNENITFQTDSGGDLWLHQHIKVGGTINNNGVVSNANAGIYGIESVGQHSSDTMGPRRDDNSGDIQWDDEPLRFWAGPRNNTTFSTEEPELYNSFSTDINKFTAPTPALARFKVSKSGRIVASGIDVGGWIGGGKFLRSKGNQAVLRSDGYNSVLPVLAIGTTTNSVTSGVNSGQNYNFRVFQTGELNIGNGQFIAEPNGTVTAKALNIISGTTAGFTISSNEISVLSSNKQYKVSLKGSNSNNKVAVISAGSSTNPEFQVFNNGTVKISADSGNIGGLTISSNSLVFSTSETISSTTYIYTVGLYSTSKSTGLALQIGTTKINNSTTTAPFRVYNDGRLYASKADITGEIKANSGKIGGTDGFTIIRENYNEGGVHSKIYSGKRTILSLSTDGKTYIENTSNGIYLGTDGIALGANNKFKVTTTGSLTAKSGSIAGWDISDSSIYKHNANTYYVGMQRPSSSGTVVFYAGTSTNTNAEFYVKADGTINASKLTIQKANNNYYAGINNSSSSTGVVFYAGSNNSTLTNNNFYVRNDGYLKATWANIGGWNVDPSSLYKDNNSYRTALFASSGAATSTTPVIYVGNKNKQTSNDGDTKFKVSTDGSVFFHGNIYGWSNNLNKFRPGLSVANMYLYDVNQNQFLVEINQGLIVDITTSLV